MKTSFEKFMASSAVQVELSIVDFDKLMERIKAKDSAYQSSVKAFQIALEQVKIIKSDLIGYSLDLSDIINAAQKQAETDVKAAKELGVDAGPFIKKMQEIQNAAGNLQKKIESQTRLVK